MSIIRNYFDNLNKSLRSFGDEDELTPISDNDEADEDYIPPSGTVKKKPCPSCLGLGCCFLCDRPDDFCDLIGCSDRLCKKWLHHSCDNLTKEDVAKIKTYYCPICREKPKCRKWVFYKPSELKSDPKQDPPPPLPVNEAEPEAQSLPEKPPHDNSGITLGNHVNPVKPPNQSPETIEIPGKTENETVKIQTNVVKLPPETCKDPEATKDSTSIDVNVIGSLPINRDGNFNDKSITVMPNFDILPETCKEPGFTKDPTSNDESSNETKTDDFLNLSSELSSINSEISSTFSQLFESNADVRSPNSEPHVKNQTLPDKTNPETPDNHEPPCEIIPKPTSETDPNNQLSMVLQAYQTNHKSSTPTKPTTPSKPNSVTDPPKEQPVPVDINDTERLLTPGQRMIERNSDVTQTPHPPTNSQLFQHDLSILKHSIDDNYKLNELVTSLRSQLKTSYKENQKLREHVRKLEENIPTLSVMDEKKLQITNLTTINDNLRLDLAEKNDYIADLEMKHQETNEKFHLANERCAEIDKEIDQNNRFTMEKRHPRAVIAEYDKLRRLYNTQHKQITELARLNEQIRKVAKRKSDEVDELTEQIKDLTKDDIQKKILLMVLDENKKLASDAQLGRRRLLILKEEHKHAEQEMIREMEQIRRPYPPKDDPPIVDMDDATSDKNNASGEWETLTEDGSVTEIPKNIRVITKAPNQRKHPTETPHIPDTASAASIQTRVFENSNKREENQTYRRGSILKPPETTQTVCKWYMQGNCRFGKWCRNPHPKPNNLTQPNSYQSPHHPAPYGQYQERPYGPLPNFANPYNIPKPPIPSLFANPHPFPYPYQPMPMFNFPHPNVSQFPNSYVPAPSNQVPNQLSTSSRRTSNQKSSFSNPNLITLTQ